MKGHEDSYSAVFHENIEKLIKMYETHIFVKNELIAYEYVDTFVFKDLYDDIMSKLNSFYEKEEKDLAKKIKENIKRFEYEALKLPSSIEQCDFTEVYEKLNALKDIKTCFEKTNFLADINNSMLNEAKNTHEKINQVAIDSGGDFLLSCWTYVIVHSNVPLIAESMFFKMFARKKKSLGGKEYIMDSFICSMEMIKKELLQTENDINIYEAKPYIVETPD